MSNFAARLDELMERATPLPWCAESCGEKGDGSDIIGVAFHPDDTDAERQLSGWLKEWDAAGNEIEYYRDEEVAELSHRTQNPGGNAGLIMFLVNHAPAIRDLVRAAEMTLATLPHMGGNEMSAHNLAMALSEALAKLEEA